MVDSPNDRSTKEKCIMAVMNNEESESLCEALMVDRSSFDGIYYFYNVPDVISHSLLFSGLNDEPLM